ncbi:G-type lectin S-receptor-like serine/threonine-protein kinase [Arachis hypogaea]|uniref:Protein kinase domain-containing protein n=1 Tax=Arachis hypogaea TaxID=3818 RepID=A0A444ZIA0_ARAHY|nr:G-type lectin S-receptor-like serine/threonine-protein kinase [Arachis hypogaea]RYR13946.1 hypothetical protein Ahy_B04g070675 [Arachis hypogaea]
MGLGLLVGLYLACRGSFKEDIPKFQRHHQQQPQFAALTIVKFLNDIENEKPIRFTHQQLRIATDNYTNLLGSGGFGTVFKGIFSGTMVAVKVLHGTSDKIIQAQFMAEMGTLGKLHHFNLVRLYGFCFGKDLTALVYECMANGSLDQYLLKENNTLGFEKLFMR